LYSVALPSRRRFLQQSPEAGAVEAGQAGDAHLRNAIAALPDMALVRGRFVQTHVGDGRDDALRAVVLDLLEVRRQRKTNAKKGTQEVIVSTELCILTALRAVVLDLLEVGKYQRAQKMKSQSQ